MTAQETIETIRNEICCEKGIQRYCRDSCINGADQCAYSMAMKALEKQVPKKVKYLNKHGEGIDLYNKDYYNCPSCGRRLRNKQKDNHCGRCGQKLDWG